MLLDFFTVLESNKKVIKVYDISSISESLPTEIYALTLDITSAQIPEGQIKNKLDVITYLRLARIQKEIFTVTSDILGVGENEVIPDGVYHFYYNINRTITKERTFLIYATVEEEVNKLLKDVNYGIEVNTFDYQYVGDYSKYDIEKVRLAVALLDSLKQQSQLPDEVKANDTLNKLERLLEIIKNDINN